MSVGLYIILFLVAVVGILFAKFFASLSILNVDVFEYLKYSEEKDSYKERLLYDHFLKQITLLKYRLRRVLFAEINQNLGKEWEEVREKIDKIWLDTGYRWNISATKKWGVGATFPFFTRRIVHCSFSIVSEYKSDKVRFLVQDEPEFKEILEMAAEFENIQAAYRYLSN